ncbi:Iron-regulated protein A precursor [Pseudomonas oleovorans subsp. oleovorans]|uniref:Peptidase M75, Imelysin n=1 Tax=Ectopseudomonas oleovorans TaxID=301 RepID=A0A379JMZ0_ECTOL|nr:imelysin family protein [Pseudomonas oleovorans]OWK38918.1 Iron-regulated protein A precursor [Pseudomonas oleovorans subsp. oleovorans]SEJ83260.1 putative iron-regulated protein [Pseudomonas oleovorans]SUD50019.1 peptidase M75, Imelysin [Pseudomonas oleovorans]
MIRMPLASASLLAIAISLAGCGEDKAPATQAAAPAAATESAAPATAAKVDEAAAKAVVNHYADLALAVFSDAASTGKALQAAVDALLADPSEATLKAAREAWLAARVPYMQTEVFRFGNPVVDEWEGQLNAWPLDEGLIDYVAEDYQHALGNPGAQANIIANTEIQVGEDKIDVSEITGELLASLNELGGSEANVATGYHAIEFLLWGQDLNGTNPGAGERPYTDYLVGEGATGGHNERRRTYLKAATDLLVSDLNDMVEQWKDGVEGNYRSELVADSADNGLRKMLFGMGSLSLGELAGERMKVALEANSTEDEHDCFSDNTHNSHFYNGKGIRNVYLGEYKKVDGSTLTGPSLSELVAKADAQADATLKADLQETEAKLQALVDSAEKNNVHFDQLIAQGNAEGQQLVRDAIAALVKQTGAIEQAAGKLGISDLNPDTADHKF